MVYIVSAWATSKNSSCDTAIIMKAKTCIQIFLIGTPIGVVDNQYLFVFVGLWLSYKQLLHVSNGNGLQSFSRYLLHSPVSFHTGACLVPSSYGSGWRLQIASKNFEIFFDSVCNRKAHWSGANSCVHWPSATTLPARLKANGRKRSVRRPQTRAVDLVMTFSPSMPEGKSLTSG
jgi:hypothetical protein